MPQYVKLGRDDGASAHGGYTYHTAVGEKHLRGSALAGDYGPRQSQFRDAASMKRPLGTMIGKKE